MGAGFEATGFAAGQWTSCYKSFEEETLGGKCFKSKTDLNGEILWLMSSILYERLLVHVFKFIYYNASEVSFLLLRLDVMSLMMCDINNP